MITIFSKVFCFSQRTRIQKRHSYFSDRPIRIIIQKKKWRKTAEKFNYLLKKKETILQHYQTFTIQLSSHLHFRRSETRARIQFANSAIQKHAHIPTNRSSPLCVNKYDGSWRQYRSTVFPSDPCMASFCFQQADAIMQRWIITERLPFIRSASVSVLFRSLARFSMVDERQLTARDTILFDFRSRREIYGNRQFHDFLTLRAKFKRKKFNLDNLLLTVLVNFSLTGSLSSQTSIPILRTPIELIDLINFINN